MQKHMRFLTSKLAEPPRAIYPKIRLGGSASSNPLGAPLENHIKKLEFSKEMLNLKRNGFHNFKFLLILNFAY